MTPSSVVELVSLKGAGYRDLYYRWEHEQWEAGKISLETDAAAWPTVDAYARRHLGDAVNWRRVRSELATTALVSFVDAAPTEEQQVFLTTQLADEARAGVFLDRVADEVLGASGQDMATRSGSAAETVPAELHSLLETTLPGAAARLRAASDPARELIGAVASYHLGVLGLLGLTELRALLEGPAGAPSFSGIAAGLAMMERDAIRHVAFALLFLAEAATEDGGAALQGAINEVVPRVLALLGEMTSAAPGLGTAEEIQQRGRTELTAWLRAVKLRVPALT